MFELVIRALCDYRPHKVDAAYLFAQTPDNQASVLFKGRQLLKEGITSRLLFAQTGERSGYLGFEVWQEQLLAWNVAASSIAGVPVGYNTILHTLSEATALAEMAKAQQYRTILVVAPPFHQPRAFMTAITAAIRIYPGLQVYSQPGETLFWLGEAIHSQGNEKALRKDLIQGEAEKIAKYQAQGDLASYEEVLTYLNLRDAQSIGFETK